MSRAIKPKKWTTDEIINILSYINDYFKNSSGSLARACDEAMEHLQIERTHKSVYSKIRKLIQAMKVWLSDHVKNEDVIIWQDDRVYTLLESICKRSTIESTFGEKGKSQQKQIFKENNKVENSSDMTDSTWTVVGDYDDPVEIYKSLMIESRQVEDEARKVYESANNVEDVKCHEILQVIKQEQEFRDEMFHLFAETEKKINDMRSL
ncbi:14868_t:CDS:2 [Funneliformis mosseae]|uniref:14868_t:CDS:1 n=1 Tax=Funneliformis mosseae TaxID=27381 RepID=A0A9N9EX62_FUNMO|nr:14868_t:CDS:2 [Funneliformis mosseae]